MEELNIRGLVLKSSDFGDNDKLLTIMTEERGKILATIKGGKSLRSKFVSVSEQFTYATFSLRKTSKYFYVYDAEAIDDFYPIREDLYKMALGAYLCDIASELSLEESPDEPLMKLTLNALFALAYRDTDLLILKAAFEFKAAVISGFMPAISECSVCGREPEGDAFIDAAEGNLICSECMILPSEQTGLTPDSVVLPLTESSLAALRYLEDAPIKRFLSFKLTGDERVFANVCEKYLTCHLEKELYTLTFYKSLLN